MDLDLSGKRRDDPIPGYARRLRSLRRICAALAGSVAFHAALSWLLVRQAGGGIPGMSAALPLSLSLFAASRRRPSSASWWLLSWAPQKGAHIQTGNC